MPRAKRSKQYRKLMQQFCMSFGFREPYQVLVDADFLLEANKCKMDILARLEDTLHSKQIKPMISQCSMRHLYGRKAEGPAVEAAINQAKTQFERRFCGHRPEDHPEPLSAFDCINSCVDPKDNGINKFHYICAINDDDLRASLRHVSGVPLLYIRKSVLIMEPMATLSAKARSKDERSKFRAEIKAPAPGGKRKREDDDSDDDEGAKPVKAEPKKPKKSHGPKGPNPLAVKSKKKSKTNKPADGQGKPKISEKPTAAQGEGTTASEEAPKKKRKRKPRNKNQEATGGAVGDGAGDTDMVDGQES